jgi:hypothetical protein
MVIDIFTDVAIDVAINQVLNMAFGHWCDHLYGD